MTFTIDKPGIYFDVAVEEWRTVPEDHRYEVSNLGRVRSIDRTQTYIMETGKRVTRRHRGVMLRPGRLSSGHLVVALGRAINTRQVHRLVLEAFVGPAPAGMECCHNDGDPANNRLDNLRWGTRADNVADMFRHGTHRWQRRREREAAHA